jgi:WD40 repeat protein
MAVCRGVVLVLGLALTLAPAAHGQDPKPEPPKPAPAPARQAADLHGDALPPGAVARLGTVRFRTPDYINAAALAPDGKALAVGNYQFIALLDTTTGRELRRLPGAFSGAQSLAFSPDGKFLAAVNSSNRIQLWDLAAGKSLHQIAPRDNRSRPISIAFSADGKTLAVGHENFNQQGGAVTIYDASGKDLRNLDVLQNYRVFGALSADGKRVLTWGQYIDRVGGGANQTHGRTIQLWNLDDGKELKKFVIDQNNVASAALSPDGKTVAATSGGATVYLFDVESGKELRRVAGRRGLGGALLFSADGKRLAAGGFDGTAQVWDVASGKRLGVSQGPASSRLSGLAFTADGGLRAYGVEGQAIAVWDVTSGKLLSPADGHMNRITSLVFTDRGRRLLSASFDGRVIAWDAATGKALRTQEIRDDDPRYGYGGGMRQMWLTLSADGKYVLGGNNYGGTTRLWELEGTKAVCDFESVRNEGAGNVFSPDGSLVGISGADRVARIWGTHTGQHLFSVKLGDPRFGGNPGHLAFAPDGSKVAVTHMAYDPTTGQQNVELIVVKTDGGKELFRVKRSNANVGATAFTHDGKAVATAGFANLGGQGAVEVWDAATGKEVRRMQLPQAGVQALAFSPDGRTLAAGLQSIRSVRPDGTVMTSGQSVTVWELATGQVRTSFSGHSGLVGCLAYSPDGRALATGGTDTTVLLWDLTGASRHRGLRLEEKDAAALWDDLASTEGERGFAAIGKLQAAPEVAVALLKKHIQPAKAVGATADDIGKLIEQMNDKKFAVRNKAQKALEELGELVAEPLRKALGTPTSEEQRSRIEKILQVVERKVLTADEVRVVRAVEVLEYLATPAAREVLSRLAEGAAGARQTREARAALARLGGGKR